MEEKEEQEEEETVHAANLVTDVNDILWSCRHCGMKMPDDEDECFECGHPY